MIDHLISLSCSFPNAALVLDSGREEEEPNQLRNVAMAHLTAENDS